MFRALDRAASTSGFMLVKKLIGTERSLFAYLVTALEASSVLMGLIAASPFIIAVKKCADADVLNEISLPNRGSTGSTLVGVPAFSRVDATAVASSSRSFSSFCFFSAMAVSRIFFFCCSFHSRYFWRLSSSFFALVLGVCSLPCRSCSLEKREKLVV